MYQLLGNKLRVSQEIASSNKNFLKKVRLILLQHLFEDTLEFIEHLVENGVIIHTVLGKQYAADTNVITQLKMKNIEVKQINYQELEENKSYLYTILIQALQTAKKEKRIVIVHEVGGYFHKVINMIPDDLKKYFGGVVEDTTFGFNRYKNIENQLKFPVFHVARSQLKEIEGVYVGEAVVLAFNNLMRSLGTSIPGRRALVVGYGMIGKNIAKYLKLNTINTTVYDINHIRLLHAFTEGHNVILKKNELSTFDVVFSATGMHAVTFEDIKNLKDGVILVSGGSKDTEFDMNTLKNKASEIININSEVKLYKLYGKSIIVIRDGTAINLREKSVPSEIIDIVYSEILFCIIELVKNKNTYNPGLHELPSNRLETIANKWLCSLQSLNEEPSLNREIKKVLKDSCFENVKVKNDFYKFIDSDITTIEQNPHEHIGILFLPLDQKSKKVFLTYHKTADLWLSPGGYIHKNQSLIESIENEIKKNLGIKISLTEKPFLCSIVHIDNPQRTCKRHYDIWYLLPRSKSDFKINKNEVYEGKWVSIQEAKKLTTDLHTIAALERVHQKISFN